MTLPWERVDANGVTARHFFIMEIHQKTSFHINVN